MDLLSLHKTLQWTALRSVLLASFVLTVALVNLSRAEIDVGLSRLAMLVKQNPKEAPLRWAYANALADAGEYESATHELLEFERQWPNRRNDVPLQLGRWYYEQGAYKEARGALGRALSREPKSAPAHLYMGLVLSRMGESRTAAGQFSLAAQLAPDLAADAGLLGGLALISVGDEEGGLALLRDVIERYPNSEPARYARLVLGERAPDRDERFRAEIYVGTEYDSNVALANGNVINGQASDRDDIAGSWGVNVSARAWQNDAVSFRVGARYDGLRHVDWNDFDTQAISGYGAAVWRVSEVVSLRLDGSVGWSTLGGDSYAVSGSVRPSISVAVSDHIGVSRFYVEVAPVNFDEDALIPSLERDGVYYTGSLDHFWPIPYWEQSWLSLGALYSRLETEGERDLFGFQSAYDHHRWRTGLSLHGPLPGKFIVDLGVNVSGEHYDNRNVIALLTGLSVRARERKDTLYEVGLLVIRPLTPYLEAELSWRFFSRDSNVAAYSYDRHVVGLLLRLHPLRWIQGGKAS